MAAITVELEVEANEVFCDPPQPAIGISTAEILVESVNIYYQGRLVEAPELEAIILELDQKELVEALEEEAGENEKARAEDEADWLRVA